MTFDRDFGKLIESESRLSAPLTDFNKTGDEFVTVRLNRLVTESLSKTSSRLMVESSDRSAKPDWTTCPQIAG